MPLNELDRYVLSHMRLVHNRVESAVEVIARIETEARDQWEKTQRQLREFQEVATQLSRVRSTIDVKKIPDAAVPAFRQILYILLVAASAFHGGFERFIQDHDPQRLLVQPDLESRITEFLTWITEAKAELDQRLAHYQQDIEEALESRSAFYLEQSRKRLGMLMEVWGRRGKLGSS